MTMPASTSSPPPTARRIAIRGDLLDFTGTPDWGAVESNAVRFRPDHWLLVEAGRIVGAQPGAQWPDPSWSATTTAAAW